MAPQERSSVLTIPTPFVGGGGMRSRRGDRKVAFMCRCPDLVTEEL